MVKMYDNSNCIIFKKNEEIKLDKKNVKKGRLRNEHLIEPFLEKIEE